MTVKHVSSHECHKYEEIRFINHIPHQFGQTLGLGIKLLISNTIHFLKNTKNIYIYIYNIILNACDQLLYYYNIYLRKLYK